MLAALSLLPMLVVACGGDDPSDDGSTDTTDTTDTTDGAAPDADPGEPLINGEPASVFYGHFVYDEIQTHNEGPAEFPLTDGKNIYVAQFYLLADKSYVMYYDEGDGEVRGDGTYAIAVAPEDKLRLTGTWRVTGSTLELGSLLACDGLSFNGERALQCQIVTPPGVSAATAGLALVLPYGNPTAPDSSRWADYH